MVALFLHKNLYMNNYRFMETETKPPVPKLAVQEVDENNSVSVIEDTVLPSPIPESNNDNNSVELLQHLQVQHATITQDVHKLLCDIPTGDGNDTLPHPVREDHVFVLPPYLPETIAMDAAFRTLVKSIDEVALRANIQVPKSQQLVEDWKAVVAESNEHQKRVQEHNTRWKKQLMFLVAGVTILAFIPKIIQARALPNFFSAISSLFSKDTAGDVVKTAVKDTAIETGVEKTIKAVMETPGIILPIFLTGVATSTLIIGTIKITLWILKRSGK